MKYKCLILFCFLSSFATAAEVYRWVDERGVTHYGEKPPQNRPAKVVDARPAAASVDAQGKLVDPPKPVSAPAAQPAPAIVLAPPPPPPSATPAPVARGMDFGVYIQLKRGMTEGEVLVRAGPPDHESVDGGRYFVVKSMVYYPTLADPFITTVSLRGGRVTAIERTRKM